MQMPGVLEMSKIEILKGIRRASARPNDRISMSVDILLNGVCDVNGVPILASSAASDSGPRSGIIK